MADIHVKGLAELNKFLETFPAKFQRNVVRSALRAGMNVIKPEAQRNVHSISGVLAAGLKVGTRIRGSRVTASLKAKGPHAFVAHMIEMTGASAHTIKAKKGGSLFIGGNFLRSVEHPGFKKKPFMRPALDSQAQAAVIAVGEKVKARLTKEGLDVSDILVEGDE